MLNITSPHRSTLFHEHALYGQTTNRVLNRTHTDKLIEFIENLIERTCCLVLSHRKIGCSQLIHILFLESGIVHQTHESLTLFLHRLIEDTTSLTGISEILVTTQIELFELTVDSRLCRFVNNKALSLCQIQEYLGQLIRRIVVEMNGLSKTTLQTRVRINEIMHLLRISCYDTDELATIVFQTFQQGIYRF